MDGITVVLQQDSAGRPASKLRPVFVFGAIDQRGKGLAVSVIAHNLFTIEPVFDLSLATDDAAPIPFAGCIDLFAAPVILVVGRDQIVKRGEGSIAGDASGWRASSRI